MLLRKGVYPYEHVDECEKFNKTLLLEKQELCSKLNMEDTKDADYMQARKVY